MRSTTRFFRALADETRWRIIEVLLQRSLSVWDLAEVLNLPRTTLSNHVRILRGAELLSSELAGRRVCLRVSERHRGWLLRTRDHFGISERINGTLRHDAARAERVMRSRLQ